MNPLRLNSVIKEKRIQRTLGRFRSVRRLHGLVSTLHQIASVDQDHLDPAGQASSIFGTLDVEKMARQIKTDGLALGLKLPETLREGMAWFGTRTPVKPWGAKEALPLEAVVDGRLPTGEPVAVAESDAPAEAAPRRGRSPPGSSWGQPSRRGSDDGWSCHR